MPWIKVVPAEEASGDLLLVYEQMGISEGPITPPFEAMTINGPVLKKLLDFTEQIRFGEAAISRLQKEMMATYISRLNDCVF